MQILGVLIMGIQICFYALYFKKRYSWLDRNAQINMSLLENRKYYVIQQIAGLVFNSTDTIVLSIFCGLKVASVYTVYNMVYSALATLINIVRKSSNFIVGQSYHNNKEKFKRIYLLYSSFQTTLGGILSSCSIVLIMSFVKLYTKGVTDIDYFNYAAAILFSINIILDCSRGASLSGANVAGMASKTTWRYILEATINLSSSLVLVHYIGMNGVLVGTIIAGIWRSIDSILFFNIKVINNNPARELIFVMMVLTTFALFAYIGTVIELPISNYIQFAEWGIGIFVVIGLAYGILFFIMNRLSLYMVLSFVKPYNK